MRPIATHIARSVVAVFVCVSGTQVDRAVIAEPIMSGFRELTLVSPSNHASDGGTVYIGATWRI